MKVTNKNYYMDGFLKKNLDRAKRMIKKKFDLVLIVDGLERSGKSTLAQQIAYYFDPTFNLDRVCFTAEEFRRVVIESKYRQAIVLDEAMSVLFSRQAMSRVNIELIKIFGEVGQKQLILIVVLPSFFNLDNYVAIHRSRVLFHVYSNKKLERGFFAFYNVNKKKELYLYGKKGYLYWITKPNFKGKFTKFSPINEKEYLKKKRHYLHSLGKRMDLSNPIKVRNVGFQIACKELFYFDGTDYKKMGGKKLSEKYAERGMTVPEGTITRAISELKPNLVVEKDE